jgi:hypothetical protein
MLRKQAEVFADGLTSMSAPPSDVSELKGVQAELDRNGNFLKGLYESLVSGDITDSEYREMKQSYEDKIAALRERERKLRESARVQALDAARRTKANSSISTIGGIADLTADVIDTLIERVLIFEDKHIEVAFKFADEIIGFPTNRRFVGKRTSDGADELSRPGGSEFSEVREDDAEGKDNG